MPTIGIPELLIILVIVLIFFGVGKLPEIGKALGEGIRSFKSASQDTAKERKALDVSDEVEEVKESKARTGRKED